MPWILVFFLLALLDKITDVACMRLADIYWNASNPIFRIDNTDHIIDVNKGNNPFEYDQVNIICPVYTPGTKEEDIERYIIYNVSKEEYDSCRITNPHPRIIAVCDKPHQVMYFTITFRSFTPQPGGLEFRPGQDYYFISTSTGGLSGLHQRIGGRCATHNMKVIFKVCCDPSKMTTTTTTTAVTLPSASSPVTPVASQRPAIDYSPIISGITKPGMSSTLGPAVYFPSSSPGKPLPPYVFSSSTSIPPFWLRPYSPTRPPYKTYDLPADGDRKKPTKKTEDRDKLPNETRAKNEELVKNGCDIAWSTRSRELVLAMVSATIAFAKLTTTTVTR